VRLLIFVHGLILALCSASVVLAAKDSQTDIGAMLDQAVATQKVVARKVVAGAQANFSGKKQVTASRPNVLMVAARDTGEVATPKSKSSVASSESRASGAKRASFQKLDVAAESVLREVLDLSSDLAIIAEQQINPPKNQLLVLVTLQPSKFFELDFVELKIDNQIVAAHPYTKKDIASMIRGGGHRLYIANLPAGTHELQAKFVGQVPRDPDYRREAAFKFIAGVNRTLIELYINSRDQNSFPQFTVREWN
jgi:hypothetical protein